MLPTLRDDGLWGLKSANQSGILRFDWELIKQASSQATPQPTELETLGWGQVICILTDPAGDSDTI